MSTTALWGESTSLCGYTGPPILPPHERVSFSITTRRQRGHITIQRTGGVGYKADGRKESKK